MRASGLGECLKKTHCLSCEKKEVQYWVSLKFLINSTYVFAEKSTSPSKDTYITSNYKKPVAAKVHFILIIEILSTGVNISLADITATERKERLHYSVYD